MDYSVLIKKLRESMILSQQEFAKHIGVSFATVNRWENYHHEPSYSAKRKIIALCKKHKIALQIELEGSENGK